MLKHYLFLLPLIISVKLSAQVTLTSSNLPIIAINTSGQTIPKINTTMGIINNGDGMRNNMTDPYNEYNGNIGIEVRGQTSQTLLMKLP